MAVRDKWNKPYCIETLETHIDDRGALFEMLRMTSQEIPKGGQFYIYTVAPNTRRGDHFHEKKLEWFTCVSGEVKLFLKTSIGEKISENLSAKTPKLVFAGPGTSHAIENNKTVEAVIAAYSSKEFEPENPDTIVKKAD